MVLIMMIIILYDIVAQTARRHLYVYDLVLFFALFSGPA